jgi:HD-like signal output (HDOD) protein
VALPTPRDPQPLPATRSRALVVLWNPDATIEHFSRVIETDPALTAAVLRAANSASSAPIDPIATPREAIVRLGLDLVRKLISGVIVRSEFEGLEHSRLSINELWRHLLATALIAEASCTISDGSHSRRRTPSATRRSCSPPARAPT